MIDSVTALVPPSLATFGDRIATGPGRPGARPLSALCGRAAFDAVVDAFGRAFEPADRRALVSLWTQYYLPALLVPYFTALSRLGCALPVRFEQVGFELDETGIVSRLLVAEAEGRSMDREAGLAALIDGHLRPLFNLCHAHSGLSQRVLWGNAGVTADVVLRELSLDAGRDPRGPARVQACLGRCGADAFARCPLAQALKIGEEPQRRVCCMRYRIPGVASCGALCPVDHPTKAPC